MNVQQIMKTARSAVSMPQRDGTTYKVSGPFDPAAPEGARTEYTRPYRVNAFMLRSAWITEVALVLAGCAKDTAAYLASEADFTSKKPQEILEAYINRAER